MQDALQQVNVLLVDAVRNPLMPRVSRLPSTGDDVLGDLFLHLLLFFLQPFLLFLGQLFAILHLLLLLTLASFL